MKLESVVEVQYDGIEEFPPIEEFIKQIVEACFEQEKLADLNLYMSVTLTEPKRIRNLNKEYRKIDKETDVLSFPMFEKQEIERIAKNRVKNPIPEVLGDAIISIQRVKEQATEYGHSFERELAYMLVHSFYHLMGEDHLTEDEKKQMREKEEMVLTKLGQTRN